MIEVKNKCPDCGSTDVVQVAAMNPKFIYACKNPDCEHVFSITLEAEK